MGRIYIAHFAALTMEYLIRTVPQNKKELLRKLKRDTGMNIYKRLLREMEEAGFYSKDFNLAEKYCDGVIPEDLSNRIAKCFRTTPERLDECIDKLIDMKIDVLREARYSDVA